MDFWYGFVMGLGVAFAVVAVAVGLATLVVMLI